MIIKSNFKDFYDFVAHQYGGDPKIVYNRIRLTPLTDNAYDKGIPVPYEAGVLRIPETRFRRKVRGVGPQGEIVDSKWLIVCGKYYLLIKPDKTYGAPWELYTEERHPNIVGLVAKSYFFDRTICDNRTIIGTQYDNLVELSRVVNAPVFTIDWSHGIRNHPFKIDGTVPILKNIIGAAAYFDPYILYQDISYFISNTMNVNPDIVPPVEIGNNDKIVGHGFDLKTSFRHRKD